VIQDPTAVFVYLAAVLGTVLALSGIPRLSRFFNILPAILFVYFLPGLSTALGVTPAASPAYAWMVRHLLPASLVLLMMTVDLPAILKLGGRALFMMLAGTLGIIVGGPVALAIFGAWLPAESWKGFAALSGSWIGGSANMVAMAKSVGTPDSLLGPVIVVDTFVTYAWMGVVLAASSLQARFDARIGADRSAIDALATRLELTEQDRAPSETRDLATIVAVGALGAALALAAGDRLPKLGDPTIVSPTTWTVMIATALGLVLSFTPLRRLERVGASKIGFLALYLMLTAIGAQADLAAVASAPAFIAAGVVWILVHVAVLLAAAWLVKAPLFFVATGSMANVGGVVSAPVVASVYHRALAPVGVLMGVAGYILGIYGGIVCAWLLARVGG
jgi:uncharacterized membrane protein